MTAAYDLVRDERVLPYQSIPLERLTSAWDDSRPATKARRQALATALEGFTFTLDRRRERPPVSQRPARPTRRTVEPVTGDWADARCVDVDPEAFFPLGAGPHDREAKYLADTFCNGCPVRVPCLEQGMDEEFGIWAGITPPQRERIKRQNLRGTT